MVLNIAHRGARSLAPENTLAAAHKAVECGADMWETDLKVSADGALVLFHDDTLVRTSDARTRFPDRGPWHLHEFTLGELLELDCGSWFVENDPFGQIREGRVSEDDRNSYRNARIPTLEDAMSFTLEADWRINVELKRLPPQMGDFPLIERLLVLINRMNIGGRHLVLSSFNHEWMKEIHRLRPDITVQALIGDSRIGPLDWGRLEFRTYNVRHTLMDHRMIRWLAEKGVTVNLWTVNEKEDMHRFIKAGAAGIITDYPQRLAVIVGQSAIRSSTATGGNDPPAI